MKGNKSFLLCLTLLLSACVVEDRRRREDDEWDRAANYRVPKGNIKVNIETWEFSERDREAFDIALRYRDSKVDVGVGTVYGPNGLILFGAQRNFSAAFRASTSRSTSRRYWNQFIVTTENSDAQLNVIQQVPMPALTIIPVYSGAVIVRNYQYRVTGSGLYVRPLSIGQSSVQLELTPFLSYQEENNPYGSVRITELTTRVVAQDGVPYVIMGSTEHNQTVGGALFTYRSQTEVRRILQVLTVEIGK